MKSRVLPLLSTIVCGAMCLALSSCAKRADEISFAKSYLNHPAPQVSVEQWLPAKPEMKGKFVLLEFWTIGCDGCEMVRPVLNKFQEEFKDQLVVIGLTDYVPPGQKLDMQYTVAIDSKARTARTMELAGAPYIMLIDPDGIVRWEGLPFALPAMEELTLTSDVIRKIISNHSPHQS